MKRWKLEELATLIQGVVQGDGDTVICGVASVEEAVDGDIVFAESQKFLSAALRSSASAVMTRPDLAHSLAEVSKPLLLVENPRVGFMSVLEACLPKREVVAGIHPTATVAEGVEIGEGSSIGANVVIEAGSKVGNSVLIMPNVYVGQECFIGDETTLYPNVSLYPKVVIGKRCVIHAGVVIGADGFGFVLVGSVLRKVPHLGGVEIGDEVEIGANTTIDRAKTSVTRIGSGTKLDNLVQIAHNVVIGRFCVIAAHTAIAGGAHLGDGVIIGGQAGVKEQVTIGSGARLAARAGAINTVPAGETYSGFPARPHNSTLRGWAGLPRVPEALRRIKELEDRLAQLETRDEGSSE